MACRLKLDFHAGADIFSTSFTMSFADYCLLRDCPVTNPNGVAKEMLLWPVPSWKYCEGNRTCL